MILHIAPAEKFIGPFIDFINDRFEESDHHFLILENSRYDISERVNTQYIPSSIHPIKLYFIILLSINKADKIIIHGLFDHRIIISLFLIPWGLKKCCWVIWGGDLYISKESRVSLSRRIFERIRTSVIRRLGYLVTQIRGDYELAVKWHNARGQYLECFSYPSNIYRKCSVAESSETSINILVGNSSFPSNNHIDTLERLKKFRHENIKIIAPLSYGDDDYANMVCKFGVENYGDSFIPITSFLPFDQYIAILGNIDVAIFNHDRQQGVGNIVTLLGLGKKVYIKSNVTTWNMLTGLGLTIFDVENINISPISEEVSMSNKRIISEFFSETNLERQLAALFSNK